MDKNLSRAVGPIEVKSGPRGILSFYSGQILQHEQTRARVLVLNTSEEGQKAVLFPLDEPDRKPFEANASWAVGWDDAQIDGPRMVELHERGSAAPLWASYVPSFDDACRLWRHFRGQEGRPFDLIIHAQHNAEYQHLEAIGYYDGNKV